MSSNKFEPCPFCGSRDISFEQIPAGGILLPDWRAHCGEIAISISSDGFNHRYNCIIHAYGRQAFGKFPKVDFMDNLIERQCEWLRKNRRRLSDGQKYGTKKLQVGPVPDGDKNE